MSSFASELSARMIESLEFKKKCLAHLQSAGAANTLPKKNSASANRSRYRGARKATLLRIRVRTVEY